MLSPPFPDLAVIFKERREPRVERVLEPEETYKLLETIPMFCFVLFFYRLRQFGFPQIRTGARIQISRNRGSENASLEPHCMAAWMEHSQGVTVLGCPTPSKVPKRDLVFLVCSPAAPILTFGPGL